MDSVLEVSEIEDYSEFPNIEIQTVEITSKNKQAVQHRERRSLASEVSTSDKATQTISRRVWRKIKRKAHLKQQDAYQTTTRSSSSSYTKRTSRICTEHERICKASRRTNQQRQNQTAFRSPERKRSIKTERERPERCSRRIEDQSRIISHSRSRNKNKRRSTESQRRFLEMNQKDLEKEKEDFQKEQDELAARDVDISERETNVKAAEKTYRLKDEHFKNQAKKLTEKEEELKVEEARLEILKKEVPDVTPGKGMEATILLQQKQLLEKCLSQNENTERLIARQMKLEEDREARERKRDKKEEESLATGKGIKPPSFKGNPGDRPEAHILRAEDWMDASNPDMTDAAKVKNFRLTLDHHAREWYDKADCKTSWKKMKLIFSRYFSTQGRSMRNLLSRWKEFKFDPQKDDIEEFVRDVKETGKQLNYGEEAIANMIKSSMPMAIYTSLYDEENLEKIITKVRDIYARPHIKAQIAAEAAASASTAGVPSATPFNQMTDQYMYLQGNGDNKQKPFKPYVTPQGRGRGRGRGGRGRGRGRGRGATQGSGFQGVGRGQFTFKGNWQQRGSTRGRGQKYDKSPNVKKARVNTKTPNMDKDRCLKCNEFGHWAKDCPQNQNGAQQKTFPGAQYNYMYPIVPQVPMAPVAMPSNGIQVPMQGPNTAALGQMTDEMMQLNEVELQDNPVFMELIEEEIME